MSSSGSMSGGTHKVSSVTGSGVACGVGVISGVGVIASPSPAGDVGVGVTSRNHGMRSARLSHAESVKVRIKPAANRTFNRFKRALCPFQRST